MKTITLLVASILLTVNITNAKETKSFNANNTTTAIFSIDEPISFIERGIEFFIFANGDFDFNSRPQDSNGQYYYKSAGKPNQTAATNRTMPNYGVLIERDDFGRIRRIGNTFINYDNRDRVSRIGSIFMQYNRFTLTQVGGLTLVYDRFGNFVDSYGTIQRSRDGFTQNYNNNTSYSYNNDNNSQYYYRKNTLKNNDKR